MHNKLRMLLGWLSVAALAMGAWHLARPDASVSDTPLTQAALPPPPAWTGPPIEPGLQWPQLVLPLLLLGAGVVAQAAWRTRRHRRQLERLEGDRLDGLEAQDQLLTLTSLLPVGLSHVEEDADGQLLARFVNPRMADLLGVHLNDLEFDAKAGWRHIHPDDLQQHNMALSQAAGQVRRGAPQVNLETLCRVQRHGRTHWIRSRAQLRLASGEAGRLGVVHIHTCADDITELRRHQKFCQDVLDAYPAPVRIRDMAGRHLLTNPAFDRLHLLRAGESLGKTDAELLPLDIQRLYGAVDADLAATGQAQVFEQTLNDASGAHTHRVTEFLLRDEDDRPYATCAISTDVSKHLASQGQLHRVLDAAPLPVLITEAGRVVYANRRCTDVLGVRLGRQAVRLFEDPAEPARLEERVAHEGHVTAHSLRLRGADNSIHAFWMTAVPTGHNGQRAILIWLEAAPPDGVNPTTAVASSDQGCGELLDR